MPLRVSVTSTRPGRAWQPGQARSGRTARVIRARPKKLISNIRRTSASSLSSTAVDVQAANYHGILGWSLLRPSQNMLNLNYSRSAFL
jgi:hypothetical protein